MKTSFYPLLLGISCCTQSLIAQIDLTRYSAMPMHQQKKFSCVDNGTRKNTPSIGKNGPNTARKTSEEIPSVVIGVTTYDLQTNGSMPRRLIRYPDGTLSAIFTYSTTPSATTNNDRGTGYNYYNGTEWGEIPDMRLENNGKQPFNASWRAGFASIVTNGSGEEIVVAHNGLPGTTGGDIRTIVSSNSAKGTKDWKTTFPIPNNSVSGGLNGTWHKSAASGDYVYVIATISGADATAKVNGGIYFSRSTDGGKTFSELALLPEIDTIHYPDGMGGPDHHTIDAFDKYVVISGAGRFSDLAIWKSEDYGATFTRTVVQKFAIPGWQKKGFPFSDIDSDSVADMLVASNTSPDILLDQQGKAHLFWTNIHYYQPHADSNAGEAVMLFPRESDKQLYYWNETDKDIRPIAGLPDPNNNGMVDTSSNESPFSYNLLGYAGQPTSGIDASGNLYLAYMGYTEGDTTTIETSDVPGLYYYNLFATTSKDGGKTWCPAVNLTKNVTEDAMENAFPSMAKNVDTAIRIIWQRDDQPGSKIAADGVPDFNDIHYCAWRVGKTYEEFAQSTGIKQQKMSRFIRLQQFPNPSKDRAVVVVLSSKKTKGILMVYDPTGRSIKEEDVDLLEGMNSLPVDYSDLANGIYQVVLQSDEGYGTEKIMIAR